MNKNQKTTNEEHYGGLDLHSNNTVTGILDKNENRVFKKRLPNQLPVILKALEPYKKSLKGIAVESTFNWYWLVDGLHEKGYKVHLANPCAIQQYKGLKHTNDSDDAFFLAKLLKLDILPQGYIYPKEDRQVRDLLRKRLLLVGQSTTHILSFQSLVNRNFSISLTSNDIKKLTESDIDTMSIFENKNEHLILSAKANIKSRCFLAQEILLLEKEILKVAKLKPEFNMLLTVPGIGIILALTIALETGDIKRFAQVGDYSSYCRCVGSQRISNNKKKGDNNRKNGNKNLAWAYVEAANFARRYCSEALAFYNKKLAKTNKCVATKALANKISKACYYIMRDRVPFDKTRIFGG